MSLLTPESADDRVQDGVNLVLYGECIVYVEPWRGKRRTTRIIRKTPATGARGLSSLRKEKH